MSKPDNTDEDIYEYLPPPQVLSAGFDHEETAKEKFVRKFSSNPLVPIGCLTTAVVLGFGMYQMRTGNRVMSQRMMRARIAAQAFTAMAALAGVMHTAKTQREKKTPAAPTSL